MLPATPRAGRCIYCAFRTRQIALQARRLNTYPASRGGLIHKSLDLGKNSKADLRVRPRYSRKGGDDGRFSRKAVDDRGAHSRFKLHFQGIRRGDRKDENESYGEVLDKRLKVLKDELKDAPILELMRKRTQDEGDRGESASRMWRNFVQKVFAGGEESSHKVGKPTEESPYHVREGLREAFAAKGTRGLDDRIRYAFYGHVLGSNFTETDLRNQKALADLRYPTEWYPATRHMHRTIHLHVGPTNSGKTYHALQRLEQAATGVYAGPLRLLAHEVYTRMNVKGIPCVLVTGEERRVAEVKDDDDDDQPDMMACTVEMVPLNKTLEVAVIDEIQMIGNSERGWAWTQALLGVKAKEVHLCGEERTVPLIQELCASTGEKLEIHRYKRLSPLKVAETSLDGDLGRLRKGDCIVSFSVMGIHALRRQIERRTGRKVATVYGSLPPETRAQQARLFNDPHNDYDFLVASDAVGMGLNLAIKRIIFEASSKFDGYQRRTLSVADTKQIAGRAGRYRTAAQAAEAPAAAQNLAAAKGDSPPQQQTNENVGLVTTLEKFDYPIVAAAMDAEPEPIRTAGIFPPGAILEQFSEYFPPGTPFSYILTRLHELSQMHSRFHLCGLKDQIWIANLIEPVTGLTVAARNTICAAPASMSEDMWQTLMPAYARYIADQADISIADIEELPLELLEKTLSANREYLRELESLHKGVVVYLWLSYRFAGIFRTRALAFHIKSIVEEKIESVLNQFSFSEVERKKKAAAREKQLILEMAEAARQEEQAAAAAAEDGRSAEERDTEESQTSVERLEGVEDEEDIGDVDESGPSEHDLDEQTSVIAGGDHFGGEEDLGFEDLDESDGIEEEKSTVSSFMQWRQQETRSNHQASDEESNSDSPSISQAFAEGERAGVDAIRSNDSGTATASGPSVAEAQAELEGRREAAALPDSVMPVESLAGSSDTEPLAFTPETELPEDARPALEAQQAPSVPTHDDQSLDDPATPRARPSESQFGGGLPPKHLHAHIDVNSATEVERDVASRP